MDIGAIQTAFRQRAAAGLDPERPLSVYERCNAEAEYHARVTRQVADGWWRNHELWAEWQTTERVDRSQTEDIVLHRMADATRLRQRDYRAEIARDLLREVLREERGFERLADLRERVGGNRVWRTEMHRGREMWVRYIDPIPRVVPVA